MKKLRITIGDKSYDVTVEVLSDDSPRQPTSSKAQPRPTSESTPPTAASTPAPVKGSAPPAHVSTGEGAIISPLAGVVISIMVSEGDATEEGQELLILEAMKMENRITAPSAGKVKAIHVSEGESVPEAHLLLELE